VTGPGPLDIVILGLSITSSWGNGHATTYRALVRALARRGHRIRFLERDVPWYAENRDLPRPPFAATHLYQGLDDLRDRFGREVAQADLVIVGSFVPQGRAVCAWVLGTARGRTAFYDIDTPGTLASLARGDCEYLEASLIPRFDLYLSFTGGPTLHRLERDLGARRARALYCSVDPDYYHPEPHEPRWQLGYLGTYSADRQPALERLLFEPARLQPGNRFVVAGALYPPGLVWPANVDHLPHVAPGDHRAFYGQQRYTLNVTRADMVAAGHAPSVRLFEAAACGVPIVSDAWPGLESFFVPGREILIAGSPREVRGLIEDLPEHQRRRIGAAGRQRVLSAHTSGHRAEQLERHFAETVAAQGPSRAAPARRRAVDPGRSGAV
jgi:spore maturation protein CgeB